MTFSIHNLKKEGTHNSKHDLTSFAPQPQSRHTLCCLYLDHTSVKWKVQTHKHLSANVLQSNWKPHIPHECTISTTLGQNTHTHTKPHTSKHVTLWMCTTDHSLLVSPVMHCPVTTWSSWTPRHCVEGSGCGLVPGLSWLPSVVCPFSSMVRKRKMKSQQTGGACLQGCAVYLETRDRNSSLSPAEA